MYIYIYVCVYLLHIANTYLMHDCMVGVVNNQEFPAVISLCKSPLCHTGVNSLGYFRCFLIYLCWRSWGFVAWRALTWHRLREKISHEPPWNTNHTGMQSELGPVTMGLDLLWFVGWQLTESPTPAFLIAVMRPPSAVAFPWQGMSGLGGGVNIAPV